MARLKILSVLDETDLAALERALAALARAAELAIAAGACARVALIYGDRSATPCLDAAALAGLRARHGAWLDIDHVLLNPAPGVKLERLASADDADFLLLLAPEAVVAPRLIEILLGEMSRPGLGLVAARRLPIDQSCAYDAPDGEAERVPLDCALLRAENFAQLDGFCADDFGRRGAAQGWARVLGGAAAMQPAAVVFIDQRLDEDPHATPETLAKAPSAGEVPPWSPNPPWPPNHPARARGTALHALFDRLGARPEAADAPCDDPCDDHCPPLLTALIRTQGRRNHTLTELLTAFAAQTDQDFEILIVGHKVAAADRPALEAAIADTPETLRAKIRLHALDGGDRARPLNFGFAAARGTYVAIVDDDDLPFAHWVESFRRLHQAAPGRVLRAGVVRQDVASVMVAGRRGLRASGPLERPYPLAFHLADHLVDNFSPPITLAFPRAAFDTLGLRFDESLTTAEDWDFLLRAVALCGLRATPQICGLYRWWRGEASSQSAHSVAEWQANHRVILRKQDDLILLADGPALASIRDRVWEAQRLREDLDAERLAASQTRSRAESAENAQRDAEARLAAARAEKSAAPFAAMLAPELAEALADALKLNILMLKLASPFVFPFAGARRALRGKKRRFRAALQSLRIGRS